MALITNQVTYRQLIEMFEQFSSDHNELNSFGYGALDALIESATEGNWDYNNYPKLYIVDDTPLVEFSEGQQVFNFQVVLCGIEFDKDSKRLYEAHIKSDMIQVYQDFLAFLRIEPQILTNDVLISNNGTSSGTSFIERFDDNLVGLVFNLSIKQAINLNLCAAPLD